MKEETNIESLKRALRSEPFTAADRIFVQFLADTYKEENPLILGTAALCNAATREGHSFLDLSSSEALPSLLLNGMDYVWPNLGEWERIVQSSTCIGKESEGFPLVIARRSALYLRKYYEYEKTLAHSLVEKTAPDSIHSPKSLPPEKQESPNTEDLQQVAVVQALKNQIYIISGGPGTGKTTTVLGYLTQAILSHEGENPLRITAVAPTGKAAARLSESIRNGMARLNLNDGIIQQLLDIPCMTVHRLLQGLPNRVTFRRNRQMPIEYDVIVVDETSMIDLPLMQKLLDAVPRTSSIVFLGDHHQLASVEVGSVFSDMTRSALDPQSPLFGKSTTLKKTYRFTEESSIFRFCEICRAGIVPELESLLQVQKNDFVFQAIGKASSQSFPPILDLMVEAHQKRLQAHSLETAFQSISNFIALTPFNRGDFGVWSLNKLVDARIRRTHDADLGSFYQGMPLIILENNYDLELFNGDMGIVWPDPKTGELFAWFNDLEENLKRVRLNWLPKNDLAYSLTIHKSQGSEFNKVVGIFSPEENEFVSKELIYTCASRAKEKLILFGDIDFLKSGIQRSVKRATRLEEQILEINDSIEI